jgi:transposase InsO family protein
MRSVLVSLVLTVRASARSRVALQLEILALRHQLQVLERSRPRRVRFTRSDRLLWVWISHVWRAWRTAVVIVQPETVITWHRRGFRLFWNVEEPSSSRSPVHRTRYRPLDSHDVGRKPVVGRAQDPRRTLETRDGGSSGHVAKYRDRRRRPPSQTWRTFLANHVGQIVAADFFVVPTAACRLLFVLVLLAHQRRRVVRIAVTAHPTAAWTAQQLREAFPWDDAPRYLLHDRDGAFTGLAATAQAMAIREVLTAPRSPWQNAYVERFIGSVRRECLDHVIILSEAGLRRVLRAYLTSYTASRTHRCEVNHPALTQRAVTARRCLGRISDTNPIGWS